MKLVRSEFTEEEYHQLRKEADRLGISLKQLVHDRAVQEISGENPLTAAQVLAGEMGQIREVLNRIIRRETEARIRLYEDDVIRMELEIARLEGIVVAFITRVLKEVA